MLRINPNIYPCNGFFYVDADRVRFTAGDGDGLLNKIVEYRSRRGQDVSPMAIKALKATVTEFLCRNNVGLCGEGLPTKAPRLISKEASLDSKISGYLAFTFRKAGEGRVSYVREEVARARAEVCAKCPNQTAMGKSCATCSSQIDTLSALLQKSRDYGQKGLKGCSAAGVDTRVAVLIERDPIGFPFLPSFCWMR
jgi:hypothetical protein